ncbi:Hypothetical protein CpCap5W_0383 [Corynebacterium pseudotuberculosis]|nr:Hypothetical protein CpPAT10_0366a [Corynebacterium pseudotuberculosis PAT10]AEP69629.1 Hypothetical protein Cp4202_0358 [Corynebacterium pseudotuberculosis 42/02-A]AEX38835.1 Hypothetical protein Cp3995_0363 [Corynebacterium pseudotuberculosis 3/99-5]AFF21520.1 Hypothetical protein CpP54B96_0365 [Corynebacterium pseudotuberculosis P54B96]AFH51283.1 Hypothetical protein Cp267_0375 [Corynebacterium pseudotuberculosis 267]AIG06724.1 hypothetical protein CPTA_00895 [Corynebacterium pseudotuber
MKSVHIFPIWGWFMGPGVTQVAGVWAGEDAVWECSFGML